MIASLLQRIIAAYQLLISPWLGQHCRFHPSCSDYARQALRGSGAVRGGVLAAKRLARCHPWNPGGIDPVPSPRPSNRD